ncbi:hypothetical protein PTTG_02312 [Puccinia triticina 1-1 BBBD Race 1]|uniref:Transcription factor Pcc1 n=2 Tax=Puccinia triticina TaxID=208348 RepID=A0A0C4ENG6_PUCT1|nr:uncharacterized protein PtA15_5A345 [Puccinia triticina]OAV96012.1 hypothetical protein PTTG_02312 [Puccinia triticina 1-1 BBBD Race 1]WAQ84772.1 hypothetical protein PtA15_5A345 [Puccinia triticina]WAR58111.1 hypothetical protein PtB15_5B343 [Puccinia triticina]
MSLSVEQTGLGAIPPDWHVLSLEVPVPTEHQAQIILKSIAPDKPVKSPHFIRRSISIKPHPPAPTTAQHPPTATFIQITIAALTLRQARVSIDHLLNDLELVIETMAAFSPSP